MPQSGQPLPLVRQVSDLTEQITRGRIFYDLWWLVQGEPMADHLEGINLYPDFFRFSRHAYLYAMIVQTMIAFDQRRDTLGFDSIFRALEKRGKLDAKLQGARAEIDAARPLWWKMKGLRDACFAHRSRMSTYDDVWEKAELRPKDVYDAQEAALAAANVLREHLGLQSAEFPSLPRDDGARLLASLQVQATG